MDNGSAGAELGRWLGHDCNDPEMYDCPHTILCLPTRYSPVWDFSPKCFCLCSYKIGVKSKRKEILAQARLRDEAIFMAEN